MAAVGLIAEKRRSTELSQQATNMAGMTAGRKRCFAPMRPMKNGKMISKLHQWGIAAALWGLMMWFLTPRVLMILGLIPIWLVLLLGAGLLLLLCLVAAYLFSVFLEGKYGD